MHKNKLASLEMRKTIKYHDNKAKKLLKDNIDVLHKIVDVLMKEETIEGTYILELLGQKKSKIDGKVSHRNIRGAIKDLNSVYPVEFSGNKQIETIK